MLPKKKPQSNFICDPGGPDGPIYDSFLQNENLITKYKFIDYRMGVNTEDEEISRTIIRLKKIFTQFKDQTN